MGERKEIFMRIFVAIISGVILEVWGGFIFVIGAVNWVYTLFVGKRIKEIANLSEVWSTQLYTFLRYMTLVSNKRPFPFSNLEKNISKFSKK